jgi:hypothetical protein
MWRIESTSQLGRIAVPPHIPDGLAVFCTTRDFDGRLTQEIASTILSTLEERFEMSASLTTCSQVHGKAVARAWQQKEWRECDSCDALWTAEMHVALGIKVADCLPVAMVDPSRSVIANVHSGWRGAVQGITAETVDALTRETAFDPHASFAYLGPSIRVCCFEVGEEVAEQFDAAYLDRTRSKPHVNLVAYTADVLRARGIDQSRIFDSQLCTRCDDSIFHSYRRDGKGGGRNLMFVAQ